MDDFCRGETQVLVSTSVVEVGVDVANATVMTILGADRFGLAQLHQLRGRVHRGAYPGYCCLFADRDDAAENERLQAVISTTNGFELAEKDFELRGPGDLLGTRQHGLAPLRIADLRRDAAIVLEARADAQQLIAADPDLAAEEHGALRRQVLVRYGKRSIWATWVRTTNGEQPSKWRQIQRSRSCFEIVASVVTFPSRPSLRTRGIHSSWTSWLALAYSNT